MHMGYVVSEEYWGRGLATEAASRAIKHVFEDTYADVLSVLHYPFNVASRKVIEKCGFRYEGTLRRALKTYDGKIHDLVCYSMLRSEYLADGVS